MISIYFIYSYSPLWGYTFAFLNLKQSFSRSGSLRLGHESEILKKCISFFTRHLAPAENFEIQKSPARAGDFRVSINPIAEKSCTTRMPPLLNYGAGFPAPGEIQNKLSWILCFEIYCSTILTPFSKLST